MRLTQPSSGESSATAICSANAGRTVAAKKKEVPLRPAERDLQITNPSAHRWEQPPKRRAELQTGPPWRAGSDRRGSPKAREGRRLLVCELQAACDLVP